MGKLLRGVVASCVLCVASSADEIAHCDASAMAGCSSAMQCDDAESENCDDPCTIMMKYARCLMSINCEESMYSSYLGDCGRGTLHVVSENSKQPSTVRLYQGVTPTELLRSTLSSNNFSAAEQASLLRIELPQKDAQLLVLHVPPLVIPFTPPLTSCKEENVTSAAYEFCHGSSAVATFGGTCDAQLFMRVHGLLNRWCDHTDKQRQAQVQISVDTTPLPMEITVVIKTIGRETIGTVLFTIHSYTHTPYYTPIHLYTHQMQQPSPLYGRVSKC
jgi:hypothetical protein